MVTGQPLIGYYLAWHRLGVGHRCETWLSWCPERWSPVVVKLARPGQIEHPRARAAVAREVEWLRRVSHPGFAHLLADGHEAQVPHLVSEHIEGPTLSEAIDEHPFDSVDAVQLTLQLAAAVRRLHQLGVAHLDIKTDNVILRDGRPVLLDLGSVRPIGQLIGAGPPMGSPGYAAPELESGEPIDARMDIYGLGGVLLEALLGVAPFDLQIPACERPDPMTLVDAVAEPARPVGRLAARLLCPDPRGRPPTIDSALHQLSGLLPSPVDAPWPSWAASTLAVPA